MKARFATAIVVVTLLVSCVSEVRVAGRVVDEEGRDLSDCTIFMVTEQQKGLLFVREPQTDAVPHHAIAGQFSVTWDAPDEPIVIAIECGDDLAWYVTDVIPVDTARARPAIALDRVVLRRRAKIIKKGSNVGGAS